MIHALIAWGIGVANGIRFIVTRGLWPGPFPPVVCVSVSPIIDGSAVCVAATINCSVVMLSAIVDGSPVSVSEAIVC